MAALSAADETATARARCGRRADICDRRRENQDEDRADVLKNENGGSGQPDRAVLLPALGQGLDHDCGRGQRERAAEDDRVVRAVAQGRGDRAEGQPAQHDLQRPQAEDVAARVPDALQREMQPDVEQEKHDAELGEQVRRFALRDEAERVRTDDQAGRQIADDRAEPERAHQRDGENADEQQQDDRFERVRLFHPLLIVNRTARPRRGAISTRGALEHGPRLPAVAPQSCAAVSTTPYGAAKCQASIRRIIDISTQISTSSATQR